MSGRGQSYSEVLLAQAETCPPEIGYTYLSWPDGDAQQAETLTYAKLAERAQAVAAALRDAGEPGDRAILLYPPGLDFTVAFFGCLYAGIVAVPAYPPPSTEPSERLDAIIRDAEPAIALTVEPIREYCQTALARSAGERDRRWICTDALEAGDGSASPYPATQDTLAFLQYSSGSTGAPKGVLVTHGNLLANSEVIRRALAPHPGTLAVSWLPPYHDMGLIGGVLQPLYAGFHELQFSPLDFLQRPLRWLEIISDRRVTAAAGPNFAYDLCVKKTTDADRERLDLSCLEIAMNGAEPLGAKTLDGFAEAFAPSGFRPQAFYPCYGLAEATLMVSGGEKSALPTRDPIDRASLGRGVAAPANDNGPATVLVGSGTAAPGQQVEVVDPDTCRRCPPRQIGEIWIAGPILARGYWGNADATAATFQARIADAPVDGPFLRTGDLGYLREDGELFVTGRLKDLIVVRGRNVYPDDIERVSEAAHPAARFGCGVAFGVEAEGSEAIIVVQEIDDRKGAAPEEVLDAIRRALAASDELSPHGITLIARGSLPKTSSGKKRRFMAREQYLKGELDVVLEWRKPGPGAEPAAAEPDPVAPPLADRLEVERWLTATIAARLAVAPAEIDPTVPFSELGLGSLAMAELVEDLSQRFGRPLHVGAAWEHPTAERLANHVASGSVAAAAPVSARRPASSEPIAIVGAACRLPGARDLDELRDLLLSGRDATSNAPADRWRSGDLDSPAPGPDQPAALRGGFVDHIDQFDASFFGISPREASGMDPQQRLLLELSWEAIEDGGQSALALSGTDTGVFVGISGMDYMELASRGAESSSRLDGYSASSNAHSIAANRLSYFLNLHGPSMAVDTACSSSLVAVHLACQSLASGECEAALAGGVSLMTSPSLFKALAEAGMLAPDGTCKTFDAHADGYARGEGGGVLVLKRLEDARAANDRVLALVRGTAVNQDGLTSGLTAPNGRAQRRVVAAALERAGVTPEQVGYVEAHGTGTPLGDPIEVEALADVLGHADRPCLLGSIKASIGHLEAAAGVAGLLKVVVGLRHRELYPQANFATLNPHMTLDGTRLRISEEAAHWEADSKRVAGVSSFGFGGTNAHAILEEAVPEPAPSPEQDRDTHLLVVSARTEPALQALAGEMELAFRDDPVPTAADVCYSAARRSPLKHRFAATVRDFDGIRERLRALAAGTARATAAPRLGRVAFLYPGQGVQRPSMGSDLYETQPTFREAVDRCGDILLAADLLDRPLSELLYGGGEGGEDIHKTRYAQPALFAFEYAMAALWESWGIVPDGHLGHSFGEYVAACRAGALSLEDALAIAAARGRLMEDLPAGAMAAVLAPEADVRRALADSPDVTIAAVNAANNVTVSGTRESVDAVIATVAAQGTSIRRLDVAHAFHSPLMDPVLDALGEMTRGFDARPLHAPIASNLTGELLPAGATLEPDYWRQQLRAPVRFTDCVRALLDQGFDTFVEVGPSPTLIGLVKRAASRAGVDAVCVPSLRSQGGDWEAMLKSLGQLYEHGAAPDWEGVERGFSRRLVTLPRYPFERRRHWIEAAAAEAPVPVPAIPTREEVPSPAHEEAFSPAHEEAFSPAQIEALSEDERGEALKRFLHREIAAALEMPPAELDAEEPLDGAGLDSIMILDLRRRIERSFGVEVSLARLSEAPTIVELVGVLSELLDDRTGDGARRTPQPTPAAHG